MELGMADNKQKIGWIGIGRMGYPMAERLLDAGHDLAVWNRTRTKAEPLASKGGRVVERPSDLADVDVLFTIVSTGSDVEEVLFGKDGVAAGKDRKLPRVFVDCSTIGVEESAMIRRRLSERGGRDKQVPVAMLLAGTSVIPVDDSLGRRAGMLLARSGSSESNAPDAAMRSARSRCSGG